MRSIIIRASYFASLLAILVLLNTLVYLWGMADNPWRYAITLPPAFAMGWFHRRMYSSWKMAFGIE